MSLCHYIQNEALVGTESENQVPKDLYLHCFRERQCEAEGGAVAFAVRFYPDSSAVAFDDSLDQRQSDAGSFDGKIEPLKESKNALLVCGIDARAVIANEENNFFFVVSHADFDTWCLLLAHELDGIVDEVLKHFLKSLVLAKYCG